MFVLSASFLVFSMVASEISKALNEYPHLVKYDIFALSAPNVQEF